MNAPNVRLFTSFSYVAIAGLLITSVWLLLMVSISPVHAQECNPDDPDACPSGEECVYDSRPALDMYVCREEQRETVFGDGGRLGSGEDLNLPDVSLGSTEGILNLLFLFVGVLATIFIVIGGARFVFAAGNPDQIKQAKSTIVYAVVGLSVAILASVIVNFVISSTA